MCTFVSGRGFGEIAGLVRNFKSLATLQPDRARKAGGGNVKIEETTLTSANQFINLRKMSPATAETVLEELFRLLEEYGPSWYTQEHHNRAIAALFERSH